MTQLKPCPFCGSDKVRLRHWSFWPDGNKSRKVAKGRLCKMELKFWRYTCCKCGKVIEVNPANPDMKGFTQYHGKSMICSDCKYKTGGER